MGLGRAVKTPLSAILLASALSTSLPAAADFMAPSDQPPAGLAPAEVPMFVMIGWDDNPNVEPMQWITDYARDLRNPDDSPVRFAFYSNGKYLDASAELRDVHHRAWMDGHEVTNHTHNHFHGGEFSAEQWVEEMAQCRSSIAACGIPHDAQRGFRTPFLEYNDATFAAARELGMLYDSSIEEGYQADHDGTNFFWPYTLDNGSPGNQATTGPDDRKRLKSHPGLWSIPIHVFMVPPDERAARYDIEPGLADRMAAYIKANGGWDWSAEVRKISGLDWNVMEAAGRQGPEFLAILKHNLDLRLAGNRAPMMVGTHTAMYSLDKPDRREAMEAFIAYALEHPEVRIVTPLQLIEWLRDPVALAN